MKSAEIVLVRHGATDWSRDLKHTGRTDVPLNDEGRLEAMSLHDRLAGRAFTRVLTSPLRRATETCSIAGLDGRVERRDELLEFDYGDYEGVTTDEIRGQEPGWTVWTHGSRGGEAPTDVGTRLASLLAELRETDDDVLICAHGHVLRVLGAMWIELRPEYGGRLALDTGRISRLGWERETPVILSWNA